MKLYRHIIHGIALACAIAFLVYQVNILITNKATLAKAIGKVYINEGSKDAINASSKGSIIYDKTDDEYYIFDGKGNNGDIIYNKSDREYYIYGSVYPNNSIDGRGNNWMPYAP